MTAQAFIESARSMIGTKWRHLGRKPWAVDCLGLVIVAMQAAGWVAPLGVPRAYGREPWDDQLRAGLRLNFGDPITGHWQAGDVPLFRWGKAEPSHVGIIADHPHGGLSIIHASTRAGVVEAALIGRLHESVIEVYRPEWEGDE